MAEASWPDPADGRVVSEAQYEKLAARAVDDGILNGPFDGTPVVAGAGLQVLVQPGFYGNVRGFAWESGSAEFPLAIDSNNSSPGTRLDWVVLRLDRSTWQVRTAVRKGTPGAGRPALVRDLWDTGVYEIPFALVSVAVGASSVEVTPYPLYVGSRIRFATGLDEMDAAPGALRWGTDGYDSFDGTRWARVLEDTGWAILGLNGKDAAAWTVRDALKYRRINNTVHLRFSIQRWTRNGLALTDENGSTPYVLPSGFRPASSSPPVLGWGNHSRSSLQLFIYSSGEIRVYPLDQDLAAGRRIYAQASFPVG